MNDPGSPKTALFGQKLEPFGVSQAIKRLVRQPNHPGRFGDVIGRKGIVKAQRDARLLKLFTRKPGPRRKPLNECVADEKRLGRGCPVLLPNC